MMGSLNTIGIMGKGLLFLLMGLVMKGIGKMGKWMGKALLLGKMGVFMLDSLSKIFHMVEGFLNGKERIVTHMMDNG